MQNGAKMVDGMVKGGSFQEQPVQGSKHLKKKALLKIASKRENHESFRKGHQHFL